MANECTDRISSTEAIERVGKAIFGDEWTGPLTRHQELMCRQYAFIAPAEIAAQYGAGHPILEALHRAQMRGRQFTEAVRWIEDLGLTSTDRKTLDRAEFAAAFAQEFSKAPKPPPKRREALPKDVRDFRTWANDLAKKRNGLGPSRREATDWFRQRNIGRPTALREVMKLPAQLRQEKGGRKKFDG